MFLCGHFHYNHSKEPQLKNMIYLENAGTRLGILPDVGGRIVFLTRNGGLNLIKSNKALWEDKRLTPSPSLLDYRAYEGCEVWAGPQSEWWKHQNLNMEKKKSDLHWPPDPYVSYGTFDVVEQTGSSVVLRGKASPISGLQMQKKISIDANGEVDITVKAKNTREEEVAWDLWFVNRVGGQHISMVPVASPFDVNVEGPTHPDYEGLAPFNINDGYFSFAPERRDVSFEACTGKAFINPSRHFIASLCYRDLIVFRFEHHMPHEIHPEHREVEIYSYAAATSDSYTELEYHAPYRHLQPGEVMTASQHWQVLPFSGAISRGALIDALNRL